MKRFVAILLITLFSANICGANVSVHFCGKLFQYFSFNGHKKKSKCCCSGQRKMMKCCKTHHHKVKVDDNKAFVVKKTFDKPFEIALFVPNNEYSLANEAVH